MSLRVAGLSSFLASNSTHPSVFFAHNTDNLHRSPQGQLKAGTVMLPRRKEQKVKALEWGSVKQPLSAACLLTPEINTHSGFHSALPPFEPPGNSQGRK